MANGPQRRDSRSPFEDNLFSLGKRMGPTVAPPGLSMSGSSAVYTVTNENMATVWATRLDLVFYLGLLTGLNNTPIHEKKKPWRPLE